MQTIATTIISLIFLHVASSTLSPFVHFGCSGGTLSGPEPCELTHSFSLSPDNLPPGTKVTLLSKITGDKDVTFASGISTATNRLDFTREITLCAIGRPGGQQSFTAESIILDSNTNKILASSSDVLNCLCPGRVTRDPKFYGFDGEVYFVKGEVGKTYAIISDKHIQLNALFDQHGVFYQHQTFMQEIGILIGSENRIQISNNGTIIINDRQSHCHSIPNEYNPLFAVRCSEQGRDHRYELDVARYHLEFYTKDNGTMINLQASINPKSPLNNRPSHGLLGQTADNDQLPRRGVPHAQQGEGYIEGLYTDYEVSHLFGIDFKYNQFTAENIPLIGN